MSLSSLQTWQCSHSRQLINRIVFDSYSMENIHFLRTGGTSTGAVSLRIRRPRLVLLPRTHRRVVHAEVVRSRNVTSDSANNCAKVHSGVRVRGVALSWKVYANAVEASIGPHEVDRDASGQVIQDRQAFVVNCDQH
jgi:hypothetical protein